MIYGEETYKVPLTRGLWKNNITSPVGFSTDFKNVEATDIETVKLRADIHKPFWDFSGTNTYVGTDSAYGVSLDLSRGSKPIYYPGLSYTGALAISNGDQSNELGALQGATFISAKKRYDSVASYAPAGIAAAGFADSGAKAVYRDYLYCFCNGGLYRYAGWNFDTSAAVVETNIVGAPALSNSNISAFLLHKDRLFAFTVQGRIYYTDAAAVGAYPETWTVGTNFIDLPTTSADSIYAAYILNGLIYIFTRYGTYTLNVYGTPANWTLKKYDGFLSTLHEKAAAFNKSVVYLYDGLDIKAFNGSKHVVISAPIRDLILEYDGVGLFPFGKGVMACLQKYALGTAVAANPPLWDAYNWYKITATKNLYFNGVGWSEITLASTETTKWSLTQSFTDVTLLEQNGVTLFNYMEINDTGVASNRMRVFNENSYALETKYPYIVTSVNPPKATKVHRIKAGFVELYSIDATVSISNSRDGAAFGTARDYALTGSADGVYNLPFETGQLSRRADIKLTTTITAASSILDTPFEISEINVTYNTSRNDTTDVSG